MRIDGEKECLRKRNLRLEIVECSFRIATKEFFMRQENANIAMNAQNGKICGCLGALRLQDGNPRTKSYHAPLTTPVEIITNFGAVIKRSLKMPKKLSIKELLQRQIAELTEKLAESRAYLVSYQTTVRQQEDELNKLTNALESLDGRQPYPFLSGMKEATLPISQTVSNKMFTGQHSKSQTATINGEEIIVEPGFHVERNSFGEDCIVPDGVSYVPAQEPVATPDTRSGLVPLPAITSGEEFDDPAEIISRELPNG